MPRIFDNILTRLDDGLVKSIQNSYRLDASIGYFNLRGWGLLADAVEAIEPESGRPSARVLIGMAASPDDELRRLLRSAGDQQMDNKTAAELRAKAVDGLRKQLTLGLPTQGDEETLRRLRQQLASKNVVVRLFVRHALHAKLYLVHSVNHDNPRTGFVGSSNLTFAGLAGQGELNVDVLDHDATEKLHKWFEDRWNDQFAIDVTDDLIEILDESWAGAEPIDPYLIYLKMAYHLSTEAREGFLEYGLPEDMQKDLLSFQASAVKTAARIVSRRGGVLIGDVVGLGKTMTATAIARLLQEDQGTETLIFCPKNLVSMWEGYVHKYRLLAKVVSLSMVKTLDELRRYRVVIVDESHNLRNHGTKTYEHVSDYIDRNDSKVILLTATPYNLRFQDVANQLALFVDQDAQLGIQPDAAMSKDPDFRRKTGDKPGTLGGFRKSEEPEDWRRLMANFLVRRTRRFIRENYAATDEQGREYLEFADGTKFYFPERIARPLPHELAADDPAALMVSDTTLDAIAALKLPRYALGDYLVGGIPIGDAEQGVLDDLQKASGNLSGITRVAIYKRLSSSGAAFIISLQRHLLRNWVALNALRVGKPLPIGHVADTLWQDDQGPDQDALAGDDLLGTDRTRDQWSDAADAAYAALEGKKSKAIRWIGAGHFTEALQVDLEHDIDVIQRLLNEFGEWDPGRDSKLDALVRLVTEEHRSEKVLVFTEYKDTAEYVGNALKGRGVDRVEFVSGSTDDPTEMAHRFSPESNKEIAGLVEGKDELRVLVSTDVLSEGQNLQDAHIVLNYDLPWAIIKIIQRAGRVDRIGQKSPEVLVYSFLPSNDIDAVIDLRRRIARRLRENAFVFGSDEEFFGDDGEKAFLKDLYAGGHGLPEAQEDDEDVDWASRAYAIWSKALEGDPTLEAMVKALPDAVYSTRPPRSKGEKHGVVVHARSELGFDALAFTDVDGVSRLLTPYEGLRLAECRPETRAAKRLADHHALVAQAVTGPLQSPADHLEGALSGVRKRCWDRLSRFAEDAKGTLFDRPALKSALDELYRKPLRGPATGILARALRERTPDEVAQLIVNLHEEGRLCIGDAEVEDADVSLLCSLGIGKGGR